MTSSWRGDERRNAICVRSIDRGCRRCRASRWHRAIIGNFDEPMLRLYRRIGCEVRSPRLIRGIVARFMSDTPNIRTDRSPDKGRTEKGPIGLCRGIRSGREGADAYCWNSKRVSVHVRPRCGIEDFLESRAKPSVTTCILPTKSPRFYTPQSGGINRRGRVVRLVNAAVLGPQPGLLACKLGPGCLRDRGFLLP